MKTLSMDIADWKYDFMTAKKVADSAAEGLLGASTCLSWYDGDEDREAPSGAAECHDNCPIPAYVEYAESRGAQLKVDMSQGRFVFCYRTIAEFL